jgi:hypothetical protein
MGGPVSAPETKWTPGEWRIGDGQHSNAYHYEIETVTPRGRRIVLARIPAPRGKPEEATANARLFVAAKPLYEALSALVESIDALGTVKLPKMDAARAALAKAVTP